MNVIAERYKSLTEREQKLVLLSTVVAVIALLYFGIWAPLNESIERERRLLSSQQALLEWVEDTVTRARQLRAGSGANKAFSGSLAQAVNRMSAQHNIAITRMQPQDEELQVWVDEAPFNDVLAWLQSMEKSGILILQADITEANTPGYINIRRLQLGKA